MSNNASPVHPDDGAPPQKVWTCDISHFSISQFDTLDEAVHHHEEPEICWDATCARTSAYPIIHGEKLVGSARQSSLSKAGGLTSNDDISPSVTKCHSPDQSSNQIPTSDPDPKPTTTYSNTAIILHTTITDPSTDLSSQPKIKRGRPREKEGRSVTVPSSPRTKRRPVRQCRVESNNQSSSSTSDSRNVTTSTRPKRKRSRPQYLVESPKEGRDASVDSKSATMTIPKRRRSSPRKNSSTTQCSSTSDSRNAASIQRVPTADSGSTLSNQPSRKRDRPQYLIESVKEERDAPVASAKSKTLNKKRGLRPGKNESTKKTHSVSGQDGGGDKSPKEGRDPSVDSKSATMTTPKRRRCSPRKNSSTTQCSSTSDSRNAASIQRVPTADSGSTLSYQPSRKRDRPQYLIESAESVKEERDAPVASAKSRTPNKKRGLRPGKNESTKKTHSVSGQDGGGDKSPKEGRDASVDSKSATMTTPKRRRSSPRKNSSTTQCSSTSDSRNAASIQRVPTADSGSTLSNQPRRKHGRPQYLIESVKEERDAPVASAKSKTLNKKRGLRPGKNESTKKTHSVSGQDGGGDKSPKEGRDPSVDSKSATMTTPKRRRCSPRKNSSTAQCSSTSDSRNAASIQRVPTADSGSTLSNQPRRKHGRPQYLIESVKEERDAPVASAKSKTLNKKRGLRPGKNESTKKTHSVSGQDGGGDKSPKEGRDPSVDSKSATMTMPKRRRSSPRKNSSTTQCSSTSDSKNAASIQRVPTADSGSTLSYQPRRKHGRPQYLIESVKEERDAPVASAKSRTPNKKRGLRPGKNESTKKTHSVSGQDDGGDKSPKEGRDPSVDSKSATMTTPKRRRCSPRKNSSTTRCSSTSDSRNAATIQRVPTADSGSTLSNQPRRKRGRPQYLIESVKEERDAPVASAKSSTPNKKRGLRPGKNESTKKTHSVSGQDGGGDKKNKSSIYQVTSWEERYTELKAYKKKYGDCFVRTSYGGLGCWVKTQRRQYRKMKQGRPSTMTPYRIKRLEKLGFVWDASFRKGMPDNDSWERRYKELKAYKRKHGDCLVRTKSGDLGRWVLRQRMGYRNFKKGTKGHGFVTIIQEHIDRLDAIGFVWEVGDMCNHRKCNIYHDKWNNYYKQLKAYKKKHGDCLVPTKTRSLGKWVVTQRMQYRDFREGKMRNNAKLMQVMQERINKLDSIGFVWSVGSKGRDPRKYD